MLFIRETSKTQGHRNVESKRHKKIQQANINQNKARVAMLILMKKALRQKVRITRVNK